MAVRSSLTTLIPSLRTPEIPDVRRSMGSLGQTLVDSLAHSIMSLNEELGSDITLLWLDTRRNESRFVLKGSAEVSSEKICGCLRNLGNEGWYCEEAFSKADNGDVILCFLPSHRYGRKRPRTDGFSDRISCDDPLGLPRLVEPRIYPTAVMASGCMAPSGLPPQVKPTIYATHIFMDPRVPFPTDTQLLLGLYVGDGVGDLEHFKRACAALITKGFPPDQIYCVVLRSEGVPEAYFNTFSTNFEALTGHKICFLTNHPSDPRKKLISGQEPEKFKDMVWMDISNTCLSRTGSECPKLTELGWGGSSEPFSFIMGLGQGYQGVWQSDIHRRPIKERQGYIQEHLVKPGYVRAGSLVSLCYFRDRAFFTYMLKTVCMMSPGSDQDVYLKIPPKHLEACRGYFEGLSEEDKSLYQRLGFTQLRILGTAEDGSVSEETVCISTPGTGGSEAKTVVLDARVIVSDEAYTELVSCADVLAGSGDTSYIQGFSGLLPPFLERGGASVMHGQFIQSMLLFVEDFLKDDPKKNIFLDYLKFSTNQEYAAQPVSELQRCADSVCKHRAYLQETMERLCAFIKQDWDIEDRFVGLVKSAMYMKKFPEKWKTLSTGVAPRLTEAELESFRNRFVELIRTDFA